MRIPILSEEAKQLLIEATKDAASQILVIDSLEGTDIQTYNKIMNIDKIGKSVANMESSCGGTSKQSVDNCGW